MSRWFRMYDELLDDPKVQRLSGEDFKAWVNILCLASRKDGALPPVDDVAFALRLDAKKANAILGRLVTAGLLDRDGDNLAPHGWSARQYKSDASNERVKRYRENRLKAGLQAQWQPSPSLRHEIYERDGRACVYCASTEDLTIDHKVPELRGGSHDPSNLQTACRRCNAKKRDLTHNEFLRRNAVTVTVTAPENRDRADSSVDKSTGAEAPPVDPEKVMFDSGLALLTASGVKPHNARTLLGKWKRDQGAEIVISALGRAQREGAIEPVAFIEGCFRAKSREPAWESPC